MATKTTDITVGTASLSGITYYGHDSGPTLFYGSIQSRPLIGADGKEYTIHACRWTGGNSAVSVYLRLDHPDILQPDGYTMYKTVIFSSLTIGSLTLNSSAITGGFTVDGGVGFYWENISTNPFASVGSKTTISLAGVQEGPFGFEVYNPLGNALVSITSSLAAFVEYQENVTVLQGQSLNIPVTNMTNTPQWEVFIPGNIRPEIIKYTGGFTIVNSFSSDITIAYWVVRGG